MTFKILDQINFLDLHPVHHSIIEDVKTGLSDDPKWLNSMYFYDQIGSKLFTEICELEEYYVTRTELKIMRDNLDEIVDTIGNDSFLIELGSGASEKVQLLLDHFKSTSSYLAIDISKSFLLDCSNRLAKKYPHLNIYAVCADFTQLNQLNNMIEPYKNKVFYFPGSTIGNFQFHEAIDLMKEVRSVLKPGDGFLIGIDRYKDKSILLPAYDDAKGVTGQFNKNILTRINRELNANFILENFTHHVQLNEQKHRIEMHLKSLQDQTVTIGNDQFNFIKDETIHTENSYKYTDEMMNSLFYESQFSRIKEWTDDNQFFSLNYLEAF